MKYKEIKNKTQLRDRISYLLNKVEWDKNDMQWMLNYLERGDEELMQIVCGEQVVNAGSYCSEILDKTWGEIQEICLLQNN